MRKAILYFGIAVNVIALACLWGLLVYTGFTGEPLGEYIRWEWWVTLMILDLWTAKFFRTTKPQNP